MLAYNRRPEGRRSRRPSNGAPLTDRAILYAAAFLRALATGMIGVLLGLYLAKMAFTPAQIGAVVGAGLAGVAAAALIVTLAADRLGRRRCLVGLALLGAAGGGLFVYAEHPLAAAAAAFFGMLNGMGRDRGASLIIEQAILPATVADAGRTRAFAWYNVLQDAGHALGGLLAALPAVLRPLAESPALRPLADGHALFPERLALVVYVLLTLLPAALYPRLSPAIEKPRDAPGPRLAPGSRRVLWRLSALFAFDSLAGGFLTTALLAFFFYQRFGVEAAILGPLFFAARVANALSHLGAAWLSRRIGLVNTMVFTHIPSSLLLITVAWAPDFTTAALLFILREGLVEMDVPTRQSYVMALVRPEERTFASGVTHLVRVAAWAVAPSFAGLFMQGLSLMTPLVIGAGMKIGYDIALFAAFRRLRPPEEAAPEAAS